MSNKGSHLVQIRQKAVRNKKISTYTPKFKPRFIILHHTSTICTAVLTASSCLSAVDGTQEYKANRFDKVNFFHAFVVILKVSCRSKHFYWRLWLNKNLNFSWMYFVHISPHNAWRDYTDCH